MAPSITTSPIFSKSKILFSLGLSWSLLLSSHSHNQIVVTAAFAILLLRSSSSSRSTPFTTSFSYPHNVIRHGPCRPNRGQRQNTRIGIGGTENQRDGGADDDESFDVYSRDMRDQIRIESSEYKVIDGDDDRDADQSKLRMVLKGSLRAVGRIFSRTPQPGKLILLRCGQSEWNANATFTGWAVSADSWGI